MDAVLRVFVIYVAILVGLRLIGKRDLGQLSTMDLVTLLLIPELVSNAVSGKDDSITHALIGVATLLGLVLVTSLLSHRSRRAERLINGRPTVLVAHGRMIEANMNLERIAPDELATELRKSGYERIEQIRWAVLETDGKISVVPQENGPG